MLLIAVLAPGECKSMEGATMSSTDNLTNRSVKEKRLCPGSAHGLIASVESFRYYLDPDTRYQLYKKVYSGCTHVKGNLEIVFMHDTGKEHFDFSFLSQIKIVDGYVLLASSSAFVIPLTSLSLIRGQQLYHSRSLFVLDQSAGKVRPGGALTELQLPSLREIMRGHVIIHGGPSLCYINTINWDEILPNPKVSIKY